MTTPTHYHVWQPCWLGRGLWMFVAKLPGTKIKRLRDQGSRKVVRRWWKSQQAAQLAAQRAGVKNVIVRQCHLGDDCPERLDVLSN